MLLKFTKFLCIVFFLCFALRAIAFESVMVGVTRGMMHPQTRALQSVSEVAFSPPQRFAELRRNSARTMNPDALKLPVLRSVLTVAGITKVYLARPQRAKATRSALFFHSGGFAFGSTNASAELIQAIANATHTCLYSIDYPLAPEHRFPAALDVARGAWLALRKAPAAARCPPVDAMIGESAGGNLAAAVALSLRGSAEQAQVQVLLYPMLDARAVTASWQVNRNSLALPASQARWLWRNYVERPEHLRDERVSPALATRLEGMPKTLVLNAEYDILRDEAESFAAAIAAAGGVAVLMQANGLPHGFLSAPALFGDVRPAVLDALAQQWRALDQ